MRTGSIYDVVEVLKSLTFLSKSKSLSFREKRMLDRAKFLVVSEISEVLGEKTPEVEDEGREGARALLPDEGAQRGARQGRGGRASRRAPRLRPPGCRAAQRTAAAAVAAPSASHRRSAVAPRRAARAS